MAEQTADRGWIEEVGAVLRPELQVSVLAAGVQRQVELGGAAVDPLPLRQGHAGPGTHRLRAVLEREDHLDERVARKVAPGRQLGDERLEGDLLVAPGLQSGLADPRKEGLERRIAVHGYPQGQGVHEEADQPLDLRSDAPRHRRPHHQVGQGRVAVEQRHEGGEQGHERGGAAPPSEPVEPVGQAGGQGGRLHASTVAPDRRPRPVRRQLDDGGPGQPIAPPGDLPLQLSAGEPAPLPGREVRVLHG